MAWNYRDDEPRPAGALAKSLARSLHNQVPKPGERLFLGATRTPAQGRFGIRAQDGEDANMPRHGSQYEIGGASD